MQLNRSFLTAAVCLVLVPVALAGMFWSAWKQPIAGVGANTAYQTAPQTTKLNNKQIHADEAIADTLDRRFLLENSLPRLQQIEGALASFRRLTEKSQSQMGKSTTDEVGNTDWETQNLGFTNWVGSVEGTLRQQDYQIKKIELELAKIQFEEEKISRSALDQKTTAYKKAQQEFQAFLKSFKIAD